MPYEFVINFLTLYAFWIIFSGLDKLERDVKRIEKEINTLVRLIELQNSSTH